MLLRRQVVKKSNIAKAIALRTQEVRTVAGMGNKEGSWEVTKYSVDPVFSARLADACVLSCAEGWLGGLTKVCAGFHGSVQ